MASQFYGGPALAGEDIAAYVFVAIDASATPDDVIALTSDTGTMLGVTTQALSDGDQCVGVLTGTDTDVLIQLASGVSAAANSFLTATTGGEAKAAATGDVRMAIVMEPAASGALARCRLWREASLVPA